jgi:hypothetical protein
MTVVEDEHNRVYLIQDTVDVGEAAFVSQRGYADC